MRYKLIGSRVRYMGNPQDMARESNLYPEQGKWPADGRVPGEATAPYMGLDRQGQIEKDGI
jgi:hypothetical protein